MTDRRLANTIYLMYVVMNSYCEAHNYTKEQFMEINEKHDIINFVAECPELFDSMTRCEMVEEIDGYVART
ncbi:MAG: hypothetical protein LUD47_05695 [Clostridia bacterium]|nr:hypothetical protein [Clostridia bacterium]